MADERVNRSLPEATLSDIPAKSATKNEWVTYAIDQGANRDDVEGLTKADLIEFYSDDDTSTAPDESQPLAEPEAIARAGGDEESVETADEDVADNQPRHEIEHAAHLKAEQAGADVPEVESGPVGGPDLRPGEVIAAATAAQVPYEFMVGDGQAEAQQARIGEFQQQQAKSNDREQT